MKQLNNLLYYLFIIFLISNTIWPFYIKLNYVFIISFLVLSTIIFIFNFKNIKIDKVDLLLGSLPLFYIIPHITNNNVYSLSENIYYILFEFSLTLTLLVLRRIIDKEKTNNLLTIIPIIGCIYFFISFIYQLVPTRMMLLGIFSHFGDTYINSIDRFYGTLNYCNSSALLFLISSFISLFKVHEEREAKNTFRIMFFINFTGFLVTFSKMLTIAFILVLLSLIILKKIMKKTKFLRDIKLPLISIIIPSMIFVRIYRDFLINLNIIKFLLLTILLSISYIAINKLLNYLNTRCKYTPYIYLLIILIPIVFLTINPISIPLKIKDVSKSNEYIISDFILEESKDYEIRINASGNIKNESIELWKLYVDDLIPKTEVIRKEKLEKNNTINFKSDKNFEYYYIKITNINKNTNLKINNVKINNKEQTINSLIVPYQYIHQLELTKYDKESVSHRILYYKDAINIVKENNSIIGEGYNTFKYYSLKNQSKYLEQDPHSYLFQLWLDTGIYGILYILGLIIIGITSMIKYKYNENKHIWFCIFCLSMIVLPFDAIYSTMYLKILLLLSFIKVYEKEHTKTKYH